MLTQAVDRSSTERIAMTALASAPAVDIAERLIVPALEALGERWSRGEVSLGEVYMGSRLCEEILHALPAHHASVQTGRVKVGLVCLNDHHVLGKKLVASSLRSAGISFVDCGQGQTVDDVARRVEDEELEVLLVSTLMLNSALSVGKLRELFEQARLGTKIIVGGAPFRFDDKLWTEVGAHAMGISATAAVRLVRHFETEHARG